MEDNISFLYHTHLAPTIHLDTYLSANQQSLLYEYPAQLSKALNRLQLTVARLFTLFQKSLVYFSICSSDRLSIKNLPFLSITPSHHSLRYSRVNPNNPRSLIYHVLLTCNSFIFFNKIPSWNLIGCKDTKNYQKSQILGRLSFFLHWYLLFFIHFLARLKYISYFCTQ